MLSGCYHLIIIMLAKVKAFVRKHKNKLLTGASFLLAGYFIAKCLESDKVKLGSFIQAVKSGQVNDVLIDGNDVIFRSHNSQWFQTFLGNYPIQLLYKLLMENRISFEHKQSELYPQIIALASTSLLSYLTFKYMMTVIHKNTIPTLEYNSNIHANSNSFDDYYGGQDIKEKFREVIDFLHDPEKYEVMGARIRRGVLFYGPPGTGKTMLARALASEAGCNFIKVVASQFQQMYVGVGSRRIRELFQTARKSPGGCIIFIDEIDALGNRLNHLRDSHQTTTTINQFLSEMDGFSPTQKVLIVGATNRIDLVDHAILRAGRFDLKVYIPPPNVQQRKGIFLTILNKKVKELSSVDQETVNYIAQNSDSWCGADIQTLINESIYMAIRDNKQYISSQHVRAAFDELIAKK